MEEGLVLDAEGEDALKSRATGSRTEKASARDHKRFSRVHEILKRPRAQLARKSTSPLAAEQARR